MTKINIFLSVHSAHFSLVYDLKFIQYFEFENNHKPTLTKFENYSHVHNICNVLNIKTYFLLTYYVFICYFKKM